LTMAVIVAGEETTAFVAKHAANDTAIVTAVFNGDQ